jgi:Ca2+-binding RTX toxin-like protein
VIALFQNLYASPQCFNGAEIRQSLTLIGNAGNDLLDGGTGNDTLSLGNNDGSPDTVFYTRGDGSDVVKEFVRSKGGDLLSFSGITDIDVVKLGSNLVD